MSTPEPSASTDEHAENASEHEDDSFEHASSEFEHDENQSSPENEHEEEQSAESNEHECDFVLNKSSKKFHKPSCKSVAKMSEKNREYYSGSRDDLIAKGYKPCGSCNP